MQLLPLLHKYSLTKRQKKTPNQCYTGMQDEWTLVAGKDAWLKNPSVNQMLTLCKRPQNIHERYSILNYWSKPLTFYVWSKNVTWTLCSQLFFQEFQSMKYFEGLQKCGPSNWLQVIQTRWYKLHGIPVFSFFVCDLHHALWLPKKLHFLFQDILVHFHFSRQIWSMWFAAAELCSVFCKVSTKSRRLTYFLSLFLCFIPSLFLHKWK